MLSTRRILACTIAVALAATTPVALAAPKKLAKPKPLVVVDKAGDANGINGQSHATGIVTAVTGAPAPDPDPSMSGPGQRSAADLLSVSIGRLDDGKKVLGLTAVFTLAAAPDQGTIYRIQASTPACSNFWISYRVPVGGEISSTLFENCTGEDVTTPMTATVTGSTITITMPFKALPKVVKLGVPITGVFGETKGHAYTGVRNPTVPTIDDTAISTATYKVGD